MITPEDLELLEQAAQVADVRYDATRSTPHPVSGCFFGLWLTFDGEPPEGARRYWNPLTDDGDAFRLAVQRGIWVHPDNHTVEAVGRRAVYERVERHHDRGVATRRAIVRAAVEA